MEQQDFKERTQAFALRVAGLANTLPHDCEKEESDKHLLQSGTAIGVCYIRACHALR